jgi:glucose 1-dehydrogenase
MQMMKSVAQEVAEKRIRVNDIAPGAIRTNINKQVWGTTGGRAEARDAHPLRPASANRRTSRWPRCGPHRTTRIMSSARRSSSTAA